MGRQRLLFAASLLFLACAVPSAFGRVLVLQEQESSEAAGGLVGTTFYVVDAEAGEEPQVLSQVGSWEASDDAQDFMTAPNFAPFHPFAWLRQQLRAFEQMHAAVGNNPWLLPFVEQDSVQPQPDPADMLRRVGCSRFRKAMNDYMAAGQPAATLDMVDEAGISPSDGVFESQQPESQQHLNEVTQLLGAALRGQTTDSYSSSSSSFFDDEDDDRRPQGFLVLGRAKQQQTLTPRIGVEREFVNVDASDTLPVNAADGDDEDEYYEYYEDYDVTVDSVAKVFDMEPIVKDLTADGDDDDLVDVYYYDDEEDEYNAMMQMTADERDYHDYGEVLTIANAVLSELESRYFDRAARRDDEADLRFAINDDEDFEQEWEDYLEEAYEYYYDLEYDFYTTSVTHDGDATMELTIVPGLALAGGNSELLALTRSGEVVLHLWPLSGSDGSSLFRSDLTIEPYFGQQVDASAMVVNDLDWVLVRPDGSVNWGLVTLALLCVGVVAVAVVFIASLVSLHRAAPRRARRRVYVPCLLRCVGGGGEEQRMLVAPLLDDTDGHYCDGKGADVECASAYVDEPAKGCDSVAKALYK